MWENDYLDKSTKEEIQSLSWTCKTKPTISILSIEEAKNYLKISHHEDNSLITLLIKSSVNSIENVIHKVIHKSTFIQKQTGGTSKIKLMKCPVIGTPTVTYCENFNSTGTTITDFRIVNNILYHADNYFISGREGDGYSIEYDTGLFSSSTDDNSMEYTTIKNVMARLTAYLYENRQQYCTNFNEENWAINYNTNDIPLEFKTMLLPLRESNLGVL